MSIIITLNVGGVIYYTDIETLNKYDSILKNIKLDDKNEIFINRNGIYFSEILEFMRNGENNYNFPKDFDIRKLLSEIYVLNKRFLQRQEEKSMEQNPQSSSARSSKGHSRHESWGLNDFKR